ncbi:hypothetical protein [Mesorhizobium sp. M0909]|uniref:hypothetical protein n=1 Tax=Mesorhizobium sp. M0909 TaxID=2957024 RepID=UPI00333D66A4
MASRSKDTTERTSDAARALIDDERTARDAKTARVREQRLRAETNWDHAMEQLRSEMALLADPGFGSRWPQFWFATESALQCFWGSSLQVAVFRVSSRRNVSLLRDDPGPLGN